MSIKGQFLRNEKKTNPKIVHFHADTHDVSPSLFQLPLLCVHQGYTPDPGYVSTERSS